MSTDWGEDRLEDYARYDEAEVRLAMRSVKAAVARSGNQTYKELLDLFWPDPVLRSSDLSGEEAVGLFNAISFAMWMFGPSAIMNTHVTILWASLQISDHQHAMRLQGKFLNRSRKWGAVGLPGTHPDRQRRHARTGEGFHFRYVYACENATQQGFHSHILCTVPRHLVPAFAAWSRHTLAKLAKHPGDETTVKVVASQERTERASVTRCWTWFRYLAKQLAAGASWGTIDGPATPLRTILQVWPHRTALPVTCTRLTGGSQDIWTGAQQKAGFRSELVYGDLDRLFSGGELEAWRERAREERQRQLLERIWPTLNIG